MRQLFRLHHQREAEIIADYARAEERGEVQRQRDSQGLTPMQYAARLFADGIKKGWIRQ